MGALTQASLGPNFQPISENSSPLNDDLSDILGLPSGDGTTINPTVNIAPPDQTVHGGLISSLQTIGGSALDSVESGASSAWASVSSETKEILSSAELGAVSIIKGTGQALEGSYDVVKQVGNDALAGVEKIVSFSASTIIFVALGIGVALYIATKTGNLKLSL